MTSTTEANDMNIVSIDAAKSELETLVGAPLNRVDPDALADVLDDLTWMPIVGWSELSDQRIAVESGLSSSEVSGTMVVVTDVSFYKSGGAFVMDTDRFVEFLDWHRKEFGERVFSGGDVIAWVREARRLWLFHHEGVFARKALHAAG